MYSDASGACPPPPSHLHISGDDEGPVQENMVIESVHVLQKLQGHTSDVTCCDFAPNFTLITGSSDKTIRIWEWVRGSGYVERIGCSPLRAHKYGVTAVNVSPRGAMFAATSVDGTATLWGLRTTEPHRLATFVQVNSDAIRTLRFAPDSTILVTGGDNGAICVWDLIHRSLVRSVFKHEGTVQALTFTSDSQLLVSGCSLGVVHLWRVLHLMDTTLDRPPQPLLSIDNAHDLGVLSCDISPIIQTHVVLEDDCLSKKYTVASSGNDEHIKLWTIIYRTYPKHMSQENTVSMLVDKELHGHESAVTCVKYNAAGTYLATASLDKTIKLWTPKGDCLISEENHSRYVNCIAFARNSILLASGSNDKSVLVWTTSSTVSIDVDLIKPHMKLGNMLSALSENLHENQVLENAEQDKNDVELIEMIDDISDGSINACQFFGNNVLATGAGDKLIKIFTMCEETRCLDETSFSPFEGHTYPVLGLDFSVNGDKMLSCSQDGLVIMWDTQTGEQLHILTNSEASVRVCRFSHNGHLIVTAGDDNKAAIWDAHHMNELVVLEGHSDSVTSACFTPDDQVLATVSNNGDFKLWTTTDGRCIHIQDEANDLGVQYCDFSENKSPVPNATDPDSVNYLLATCGNDSFVKLWRITVPTNNNELRFDHLDVKLWRTLAGHGGNVICVKFSPVTGDILCSTATDKQARLWSVYSAECLYVVEHNSMALTCSFSNNLATLAVGCLDKTLWLWKLPHKLILRTIVASSVRTGRREMIDWRPEDLVRWARDMEMPEVADKFATNTLTGQQVLMLPEQEVCATLQLDDDNTTVLIQNLRWLKEDELKPVSMVAVGDVPDEFLCPITHELMRIPVTCADGFTYEKQAITEWFLSGKFSSPMTNQVLANTHFTINHTLRTAIHEFLYGSGT